MNFLDFGPGGEQERSAAGGSEFISEATMRGGVTTSHAPEAL